MNAPDSPEADPKPASESGLFEPVDELELEARYRVMITDWSTNRDELETLVAKVTKIPKRDVREVLKERPAVLAEALPRDEAASLVAAFEGSGANVQMIAHGIPGIERVLDDFLLASAAKSVLLMDRGGFKICERGDHSQWDVEQILGLIAGVFAATKRISQFLGEEDFGAHFHPGDQASIFLSLVGERGVMVTQFDRSTAMRVVRLYALEAAQRLSRII